MIDSNSVDDTSADYEQFERTLVARDRDAVSVATADIDEATAQNLVSELVDADVVTPVPKTKALVHEPSGRAFDSITQLAVFHRGWTAARDVGEGGE
ncbi:hypothetical protein BV210_18255 (plasmid) [Halorientalis sp. IM1011]|uniref:hypothetical protein n=1 Tax=Halorientalis sp. IM1011 TaxID=1932360 RepID=UPI00097CCFF8|nr:hypothetical protein [Halorientalis sp. IM1011]AQL44699.1 hypothetical protein BV210_18255 [Halorientalis sp. IM1011]